MEYVESLMVDPYILYMAEHNRQEINSMKNDPVFFYSIPHWERQ